MRTIRSRRAVSPVIATVILVAVAITVSVAVAYWMGGIAGQYTKFEKVEVQYAICEKHSSGENWTITMRLKNTGTATATLIGVFINDVEVDRYSKSAVNVTEASTSMTTSMSIESGEISTIYIYIDDEYKKLSSGTTVNIKIRSAGGMDYIKLVELV